MQKKQGSGCFKVGCIVVLVVLVLLIAGSIGGYYFAMTKVKPYTSETQVDLPVRTVSPDEYASVRDRITRYSSGGAGTLILNADDLNTLVAAHPEWQDLRGHFSFEIGKTEMAVTGSFPVPPMPGLGGRFVEGVMHIEPGVAGGKLLAQVNRMVLKGEDVPAPLLKNLAPAASNAFVATVNEDSLLGPAVRISNSVHVDSGNLILQAK